MSRNEWGNPYDNGRFSLFDKLVVVFVVLGMLAGWGVTLWNVFLG